MRVQRNIGKRERFMKLGKSEGQEREGERHRSNDGSNYAKKRDRIRKRKREHAV